MLGYEGERPRRRDGRPYGGHGFSAFGRLWGHLVNVALRGRETECFGEV